MEDNFGTVGYQAPEYVDRRAYSELVDSWSMGVLFYNYITGKMPFKAKHQYKIDH